MRVPRLETARRKTGIPNAHNLRPCCEFPQAEDRLNHSSMHSLGRHVIRLILEPNTFPRILQLPQVLSRMNELAWLPTQWRVADEVRDRQHRPDSYRSKQEKNDNHCL